MSTVNYVTKREMGRRTGMPNALGYATRAGNILIRKGLDKATERRVRAHEADHVERGEEGPFLESLLAVGGSLLSGILGSRSNRRAAQDVVAGNNAAIAEDRAQFNKILELTGPQRDIGNAALNVLASALIPGYEGLSFPAEGAAPGTNVLAPGVDDFGAGRFRPKFPFAETPSTSVPGAGVPGQTTLAPVGSDVLADLAGNLPGGQAIIDDTMRRITQQASRGSSPTGGNVLQALSDRISGFQSDRLFNSLFNLAGFGEQGTGIGANAALATGANVGNALQSSGIANASGVLGSGSTWNNSIQNLLDYFVTRNNLGGSGGYQPRNFQNPGQLGGFNVNAIRGLRI